MRSIKERTVRNWKTSALGLGEGATYVGLTQALSNDPEVQKWALILAAIRLIVGLLSQDAKK